jgi:hypothetical protein
MAKVKNTGNQPRGFMTEEGDQVVVRPGEEAEFNMTEADFKKCKEIAEMDDPPLYEISGSHGGVKRLNAKEQREADAKKAEEKAKKDAEQAKEIAEAEAALAAAKDPAVKQQQEAAAKENKAEERESKRKG